jgi:hypothetical protein
VNVAAYRVNAAEIIDPTFHTSFIGCINITGTVNSELSTAITTDDDGDGFYDLSIVELFRPYELPATGSDTDVGVADCTVADTPPVCQETTDESGAEIPLVMTTYDSTNSGSCSLSVPDSVPGDANEPSAPCYDTATTSVSINLAGIPIDLQGAQVIAQYTLGTPPDPPTALSNGLLAGFLSLSAARNLNLPDDLPLVGGNQLSSVLPGPDSCQSVAVGDMDTGPDGSTPGWWFYINFAGTAVDWQGN